MDPDTPPPGDPLADPARLEALRATELLDTLPEEAFDRFTRLATRTLGAPVAVVSFLDRDRQFIKSQTGLPAPLSEMSELPLSLSLCSVVVRGRRPVVVGDLGEPGVAEPFPELRAAGVQAYLGTPLITRDGHALGSFCAIDFAPREWAADELDVLRDIAAMVVLEIELRSALRESEARRRALEDAASSIRALHGVLDSADSERLDAVSEALRVAADLAHELRTPLYAIRMLTEDVSAEAPAPLQADLRSIAATTTEALAVIEHQLDLARSNAGRGSVHVGITHVPKLLRALRGMLDPLPRGPGVRLEIAEGEGLPDLRTDGLKLAQILRNLTTNALRNTPEGEVRVSAATTHDGRCMAFTVTDTGVGIAQEDQERIFGRFEQAGERTRRDGYGTGLGLPLARRMATLVGGTITLESTVGRGSTFTLTVPLVIAEPGPHPPVAPDSR